MFCPKCGADGQMADAYCKRCGEWLPDMPGIIRRALWGQGIKPEQRIKTMLIWQAVSTALALFSGVILLANGANAGGARRIVYIVSSICFVIAAIQVDNLFVGLRMRQTFKRSRSDVDSAMRSPAESGARLFKSRDAAELSAGAQVAREATTRSLDTERTERLRARSK
jgi:hypothetical protein